ncbi:hypothetical protein [Mycoplasmopsis opalescens]|uniref:hypothetical protein n=1 Tax=Mycoplasmopsis opalescens TaxID=114886 RepID=UPI0004A75BB1|nr:hypothetical protein [Mycoplasmopsis opalescens]
MEKFVGNNSDEDKELDKLKCLYEAKKSKITLAKKTNTINEKETKIEEIGVESEEAKKKIKVLANECTDLKKILLFKSLHNLQTHYELIMKY